MRKLILSMAAVTIFFTACNNDSNEMADEQSVIDMSDFYVYTDADIDEASRLSSDSKSKSCYTMVNLNRLLNENPELERKMYDIEYHTRANIAGKKPDGVGNGNGGGSGGDGGSGGGDNLGVINIPVYVHVVYSNSQENVSDNQINSQIAVLNDDFRKGNNDISQVPALFENVVADSEITFSLAQDGIKRHSNTTSSWGTNDAVKAAYPPITPETHLNIWVCNIGGGILGYAQFPGGPSSTDGVVLLYSSLPGGSAAPYNLGRTATHEVGHYLNLRHIWGDGRCNRDDFVSDTPTSDRPNYGCPSFPTTHCRSTDMTMNYMDYTDDACMYMFSEGQKVRMRTIFDAGGARESMLN